MVDFMGGVIPKWWGGGGGVGGVVFINLYNIRLVMNNFPKF
jgi:hypothetical protein